MKTVPFLSKWELIALLIRLEKAGQFKGKLRKDLRAVLREAQRQALDLEERQKARAKKREENRKARREADRLARVERRKREAQERAERERYYSEAAAKQEARHAAWIKRHGGHDIEVIFGVPVRLEAEAAIPAPFLGEWGQESGKEEKSK